MVMRQWRYAKGSWLANTHVCEGGEGGDGGGEGETEGRGEKVGCVCEKVGVGGGEKVGERERGGLSRWGWGCVCMERTCSWAVGHVDRTF